MLRNEAEVSNQGVGRKKLQVIKILSEVEYKQIYRLSQDKIDIRPPFVL